MWMAWVAGVQRPNPAAEVVTDGEIPVIKALIILTCRDLAKNTGHLVLVELIGKG